MIARDLCLSLLALGIIAAPAWGQGTTDEAPSYELKYKYKKGTVDRYRMTLSGEQSGMMQVMLKGEMRMVQSGESFDAESKLGTVLQEIERVKMSLDMAGNKQEYDTDAPDKAAEGNMLVKAAQALSTKTLLTLKESGEITKAESKKEVAESPIQALLGARHLPYGVFRLPEKAIKIGESWSYTSVQTTKDAFGQESTLKFTFTYTLKRILERDGDQLATIGIAVKPDMETMPGGLGGQVTKAGGTGTASFNITRGHVRSINHRVKVEAKNEFAEGEDAKQYFKQTFDMRRIEKKDGEKKEEGKADGAQ